VKPKDRSTLCFVVDGAMFLLLMAMAGIGLLLAFVLLPGREIHSSYGPGVYLTFLGWDRHEWGDLHLVLSLIFVGLCVLHVALHWKQILCWLRRQIPGRLPRTVTAIVFGLTGLLALGLSLFAAPETQHRGPRHGWRHDDRDEQSLSGRQRGCRRAPDRTACSRGPRWKAR